MLARDVIKGDKILAGDEVRLVKRVEVLARGTMIQITFEGGLVTTADPDEELKYSE